MNRTDLKKFTAGLGSAVTRRGWSAWESSASARLRERTGKRAAGHRRKERSHEPLQTWRCVVVQVPIRRTDDPRILKESEQDRSKGRRARAPARARGIVESNQEAELPPLFSVAADNGPPPLTRTWPSAPKNLRSGSPLPPETGVGALLLCDVDANRIASYQAGRKSEGASARTLKRNCRCSGKS